MKNNERLYDSLGNFLYWMPTSERTRLQRLSAVAPLYDSRRPGKIIGYGLTGYKPSLVSSSCSISQADITANVGITRGTNDNPRRVKQAQEKIGAWKETHDNKAVIVSAGKVFWPAGVTPYVEIEEFAPVPFI